MIAVLDYGIGNLRSAEKALQRVGGNAMLTADPADVDAADAVVLPGVGAFGRCMEALRDSGLEGPARAAIDDGRPFLGICVGMQMLYEWSEEDPHVKGLGVLPGPVRLLPDGVKRPQMQWNRLDLAKVAPSGSAMFDGLGEPIWVYFVHSYAPELSPEGLRGPNADGLRGPSADGLRGPNADGLRGPNADGLRGPNADGLRGPNAVVVATCDYGGPVVAAVERGRLWATQFHPEKSGAAGLRLLENFARSVHRD